ncbi:MAG: hypothetical protein L3K00_08495 [Thermoplasmata archaeon]|nr:hypothetical protein [Thermoplasmata archaeon]
MTPTLERLFPGLDSRSLRAAAIVTTLAVLMGVVGGEPLALAAFAPIAGTAVTLAIRGRPLAGAREYGLAPALVAVGLVAALAAPSLLVGLIAGVTGLGVLLWNAETPSESVRTVDPVEGLFVPGLGLTVALVTVIALPAARDAVGIAAIAVVLALAMVVWALRGALVADAVPAKAL